MTSPERASKSDGSQATLRGAFAVVLCVFTLAACHSPQGPQAPAAVTASTASASTAAQQATVPRLSPFVTKPTDPMVAAADSYDALLQQYPATQRTKITAWYADYAAGSMAFGSSAQWHWMQQHDFPTPDDVLRASTVAEAQLRTLSKQGNTKANFFYLGRLLDDYTHAYEVPTTPGQEKARLRAEISVSIDRALASGSAFTGYIFGGYYAALHGDETTDLGRAAGLIWAGSFGDSRPIFTNQQMAMGFPGVSGVRAAEVYFDMFAAAARVNPHFLNAQRGQGELFIPLK